MTSSKRDHTNTTATGGGVRMTVFGASIRRMMGCAALLMMVASAGHAQPAHRKRAHLLEEAKFDTTRSILQNTILTLHAEGDTLWAGPALSLTSDGGETWLAARTDSLRGTRNDLFSLDVENNIIVAGLRYVTNDPRPNSDQLVSADGGLLVSDDGASSFTYRRPPLDTPIDTAVSYGGQSVPTIQDQDAGLSPPYALDYVPQTGALWLAAGEGGLRRSFDLGKTWERVVLPPDNRFGLAPDSTYSFILGYQRRIDGPGNQNHFVNSVLVDGQDTVWVGTEAGLNRSIDGGQRWRRFVYDGTSNSLTGNSIRALAKQPSNGALWIASWITGREGGEFGITVTRDGGRTFEPVRLTERGVNGAVRDFAFRGDTVYAAAQANGLLSSTDGGRTWTSERTFGRPDAPFVYAVATTTKALWVGTSLGLFKSTDGGQHWQLFQVEVPLHPETPTDDVPNVETFAYPNPFSPNADRRMRIRYDGASGQSIKVRIFDFNMNLVRTLDGTCQTDTCSIAWNGTDSEGLRVANGAYFYVVEVGGSSAKGKILVLQ